MDTQVLWDGCNTDDNEIALLGNQAVLKEELTDLADNAGVPELAVPELAVPQLPEPFVPINSHACHQLLPLLQATFAMVPDAAWPGPDQRPCSTAPATGLVGRLGRPSASDPGGVDRGVLSLCCPRCMCVAVRCAPCLRRRHNCSVIRCPGVQRFWRPRALVLVSSSSLNPLPLDITCPQVVCPDVGTPCALPP